MPIFNFSRQSVRDWVLCIALLLYIMAAHTWVFKTDSTLVLVELVFRTLIPLFLLLGFRKYVPPARARLLLWGYLFLALAAFFAALISEDPHLVLVNTAKYFYVLVFCFTLALILRPESFSLKYFRLIVIVGAVFALQTVVLFILIQSHRPPPSRELILVGYKNLPFLSYGAFGYGWGSIAAGQVFQVYRAQSFFPEPTRMASFQELCVILSWGLYRVTGDRRWLFTTLLCLSSFIIAFSMTGYIVMFLTATFYFVVRRFKQWKLMAPPLIGLLFVLAGATVVIYLNVATAFYGQAEAVINLALGHAPSELTYRVSFLTDSIRLFFHHPLGIGMIGMEDSRVLQRFPGAGGLIAPLEWLVTTGIVGLTIQLCILGFVLTKMAIPQILMGGIGRFVALAFVAQVLHHCVAGDWFDPLFFLVLWSLVMINTFGASSWGRASSLPFEKGSGLHAT